MIETDSPVLEFGQFSVDAEHTQKNESDSEGLSTSMLLLPSRIMSLSIGKLREIPPKMKTSGARKSVVKFADEIMVSDWMRAAQTTTYDKPGTRERAGIVSVLPSFFMGVADEITGEIDHKYTTGCWLEHLKITLLNVTADETDAEAGPDKSMLDDTSVSLRNTIAAVDVCASIHLPRVNVTT